MDDGEDFTSAAANGDEKVIRSLLSQGANPNCYSSQGFLPLGIAAFWGYSNIVRPLLDSGADVDGMNKGTKWTPLHCAAFQGHGKVVMTIMEYNPDLTLTDSKGRTASDFASAMETIWPFFAGIGIKERDRDALRDWGHTVSMKEIQQFPQIEKVYFSRPGSAYAVTTQSLHGTRSSRPSIKQLKEEQALSNGDVLTDREYPDRSHTRGNPSFNAWRS